MFLVEVEGELGLLFFTGAARFDFIELRSENVHFRLAFNGFLGKREKDDLN